MTPRFRIGIDTGGTFTDFVALANGRLVTNKILSTPAAPERAVLSGLDMLGAGRTTAVRHGSTVATNALLERKGARVAFVTNRGFEDLLEIGRQDRPELYALLPRRIPPLVPAERRLGVGVRRAADGDAVIRLRSSDLARLRRQIARLEVEAVAIGLLHSYSDGTDERTIARALARLGLPITLSSELCPEHREYERFATCAANAYLAPRVARYLGGLARAARGSLEVVLSHGGTAPIAVAAREPVRQLLSGPAAGVRAAFDAARQAGFDTALTLDVGGTSTDCALVRGELPRRRAREIAGFPIQLPMLDVHTIGAGGGSIARVDRGGLLHVGPESAGADPGPACYGRGGPPTVTDALLVLGRIREQEFAGGAIRLDLGAARRAIGAVARALGVRQVLDAAQGIVALAEAHMAAALRKVSVERGHDPRSGVLVAFGGAGGLHACALAAALGTPVLFPRHAGVLSALGALTGGSRREKSRTVLLEAGDARAIGGAIAALSAAVRREFPAAARRRLRIEHWAEMRYAGQSHELPVALGAALAERFHREHERAYGFADRRASVEVVTLEARAALPGVTLPRERAATGHAQIARTRVWSEGGWRSAPVFDALRIGRGFRARGPALAIEPGATLWIPPGWSATGHAAGGLLLGPSR